MKHEVCLWKLFASESKKDEYADKQGSPKVRR